MSPSESEPQVDPVCTAAAKTGVRARKSTGGVKKFFLRFDAILLSGYYIIFHGIAGGMSAIALC